MAKKKVVSPSYSMTREDWELLANQSLLFSAPLLIMFLTELQTGKSLQEAAGYMYAALIQILINFLKKYIQEK